MGKALEGVGILDFRHVPSGPIRTHLTAWVGAAAIKVLDIRSNCPIPLQASHVRRCLVGTHKIWGGAHHIAA